MVVHIHAAPSYMTLAFGGRHIVPLFQSRQVVGLVPLIFGSPVCSVFQVLPAAQELPAVLLYVTLSLGGRHIN